MGSVRLVHKGILAACVTALVVGSTAPVAASPRGGDWHQPDELSLRTLGEVEIPKGLTFDDVPIGELSGIDYDRRTGEWLLISDDTDEGPARFYRAKLHLDESGFSAVEFVESTDILRTDGSTFPPLYDADPEVADPESIRVDPLTGSLWWSSEGKRDVPDDGSQPQLVDPWVRQMTRSGDYLRQLHQPSVLEVSAAEVGPRANLAFEGLAFSADGLRLVTAMEGPLYQDSEVATVDEGGINRLTWHDRLTGIPIRQVAYPLDPIPVPPIPADDFADNGAVEILAIDRHRYLVLERSYASGVGNSIRLYAIDVRGASNVLRKDSLADARYVPVSKRLVADFAELGLSHVDNIEGMGWGPKLPTGERTLVFVSDDNLSDSQVSQVIAVAVS